MRFSRVSVAGLLTGLSMLGALACGEGSVPTVTPVAVATLVPSVPETPYAPPPTATPWPTFTPVPPLPTLRPTPTGIIESVLLEPLPAPDVKRVESPASTPDVQATAAAGGSQPPVSGPLPTPEVVESVVHATPRLAPTAVPGPYPTPYGQLVSEPEGEVRFLHQTLFPLQTAEVPASYQTGQPEDLPDGVDFVSQSTRFVLWVVMYDVSDAPEDWEMDGVVRWYNVNRGLNPLLMLERPVGLTHEQFMFYEGMGTETAGFWRPGQYRVAFFDGDGKEVVSWNFEVR